MHIRRIYILDLQYVFNDRTTGVKAPEFIAPPIPSDGYMLNGRVYKPALDSEGEKSPCAIMLHGLPGNDQMRDVMLTLQRVGFVVVAFNFRGVWGSEGSYDFETLMVDSANVLTWIKEHAEELGVDTDRIYFVGHSMGGFTGMNLLASDLDFKGAVLIAPADIIQVVSDESANDLVFSEAAPYLHFENGKDIRILTEECRKHKDDWPFPVLAEKVDPNRPFLVIGGLKDLECHPDHNIEPMMKVLKARGCKVDYQLYESDHSFLTARLALNAKVAEWLVKQETKA